MAPKKNDLKIEIGRCFGEFIGTAFFLFMGVGGAVNLINNTTAPLQDFAIPFCFGFSLFVNVFIWAGISGGVLNPAITIALTLTDPNNYSWIKGIAYIVCQLLGALIGSWFIDLVQPGGPNGATMLGNGVSIAQGLFLEVFATSVLTMTVLFISGDNYNKAFGVGMALFVSALCAGPYTGASLNPARTFGPAIVAKEFGRAHWIYYIGPILGSLLAAGYWHILRQLGVVDYPAKKGTQHVCNNCDCNNCNCSNNDRKKNDEENQIH
ncbi:hypothetical protein RclHR1_02960006 [Rhizophagus clarus]|uniref:Aquaporin-like protein n=1 Tax=Rhizophagus clarus TaxID=94130 RepID=A0A2Z6R525_9GLOM|nr:hypothetical protein RclHR1_02960006 [Rhizophagus clarus]GES89293.1 aquaporin-like protein [Rhizophagus clarus]